MRLLKCPKCGEMFSDTYKTCPFCQEDEELHSGKVEVNWMSCEKPDAPVQQGDVLTARGLGKCLVESVGGQSRKGRTGITMKRFL